MTHPTPYPRCIFCGAKANSREHAIPKWIGKRFGIRKQELNYVATLNLQKPRKQPIMFGSHRERIFCKDCNAHFKHLEDETIPILEWMARGRSVVLGQDEQRVLARWGAKTGFALIAAERDLRDLVPFEHTKWLRERDEPPPLVWVGYASWNGRIFKFGGDTDAVDPEGRSVQTYGALLTFAQIALKVFGLTQPIAGHRLGFDTGSLKQVWPPLDRSIRWPLFPAAQEGNVEQMATLPPLTPTS